MNILIMISSILFLHYFIFFINVKAQNLSGNTDGAASSQDSVTNFQPGLAVVITMLGIMFFLTFLLLLYAKICHRASFVHNTSQQIRDGLPRSRSTLASGLDKTVIESLPFFRFSYLKGSKRGLECSVCLAKFEDIEILRLLPKCKHAFHIDCIDQWLEKHSTCPLCRQKVSADDFSQLPYSASLRFLWNQSELREESNLELYVEREKNGNGSSRRFSIGRSSFRKIDNEEAELPIILQQENMDGDDDDDDEHIYNRFNHKINVVSDVVLKNRWSNVTSSDLMFLNSEMLNDVSIARFSYMDSRTDEQIKSTEIRRDDDDDDQMMNIKEEMERKKVFETKRVMIPPPGDLLPTASNSKALNPNEKRSMSEIIVQPRFSQSTTTNKDSSSPLPEIYNVKDERMTRLWLPIARKTVQWFANRERRRTRPPQSQGLNTLNV